MTDVGPTITVNDPRAAVEVIVKALEHAHDFWPKDKATHVLRELQRAGFTVSRG